MKEKLLEKIEMTDENEVKKIYGLIELAVGKERFSDMQEEVNRREEEKDLLIKKAVSSFVIKAKGPKVKFEESRKRTTFWVKESDNKLISDMSKKMGIPKYEVIENAVNFYAEAVKIGGGK